MTAWEAKLAGCGFGGEGEVSDWLMSTGCWVGACLSWAVSGYFYGRRVEIRRQRRERLLDFALFRASIDAMEAASLPKTRRLMSKLDTPKEDHDDLH